MEIIIVINFVVSIIALIYTLKIKVETKKLHTNYTNYYKKLLKVQAKVLDINYKIKYLVINNTEHKSSLDILELQMNQVHDWLGRLTISDFMEDLVTRTGEFPTDDNKEES